MTDEKNGVDVCPHCNKRDCVKVGWLGGKSIDPMCLWWRTTKKEPQND